MAAELPIETLSSALPWWRRDAITTPLAQLLIGGGPLLVGALFPIGVPLYSTVFGAIGENNCIMYAVTQHPCPACGLTSGVICTMHGAPLLAMRYHPLGPAITLLLLGIALSGALKLIALRRPLPEHPLIRGLLAFPPLWLGETMLLALLVIYVGRLATWVGWT